MINGIFIIMERTIRRILILSANPRDTDWLSLDEEAREIQNALKLAKYRDHLEVVTQWAITLNDLRRTLLEYHPTIVHFSGHGAEHLGLIVQDSTGKRQLVDNCSLASLLAQFRDTIECVVFNVCYSDTQAEIIYQYIDCVIGMHREIKDRTARQFAVGFYDAIGAGKTYEEAYRLGCNAIALAGIPESSIPILKIKSPQLSFIISDTILSTPPNPNSSGIYLNLSQNPIYGGINIIQGEHNQLSITNYLETPNTAKQLSKLEMQQMLAQIELLLLNYLELSETERQKSLIYLGIAKEELESSQPNRNFMANNLKRMAETLKKPSDQNFWQNLESLLNQLLTWLNVPQNYFKD